MSLSTFLLVVTGASALLAGWFVARFPKLAPRDGRTITLALVGVGVVTVAGPEAIDVVGLGAWGAIFLVALPGCTYMFVVAAWVMLFVKQAIEPYLR